MQSALQDAILPHYSYRRAIMGSILAAFRAGIQQAATPTDSRSAEMAVNVIGSVGETVWTRIVLSTRVTPNDAAKPIARPIASCLIPSVRISRCTDPIDAPRAIRTPISCVRRETEYATTA